MSFGTVAILGPGLIGGSLALALAERKLVDGLAIYARSERALDEIGASPFVSAVTTLLTTDPREAVGEADIVVLCVPIETMSNLVVKIADALQPSVLVTDVGSVKARLEREIAPLLQGKALWIGSHPMAGSEKAGFAAARADLFKGATAILTPTPQTPFEAHERADKFWRALGMNVAAFRPEEHDQVVAEVSHVPHLVAAALINNLLSEYAPLVVGPGLRDTTRIASGPPGLWTEIVLSNREAIGESLDRLITRLTNLRAILNLETDRSTLRDVLQNAHDQRSKLFKFPS